MWQNTHILSDVMTAINIIDGVNRWESALTPILVTGVSVFSRKDAFERPSRKLHMSTLFNLKNLTWH